MLVGQPPANRLADPVELFGLDGLHVRGYLKDRVLAGVNDQRAGREMLGAEVLDRLHTVGRSVADHLPAAYGPDQRDHLRREPLGVQGQLPGCDDSHQLPMTGR